MTDFGIRVSLFQLALFQFSRAQVEKRNMPGVDRITVGENKRHKNYHSCTMHEQSAVLHTSFDKALISFGDRCSRLVSMAE